VSTSNRAPNTAEPGRPELESEIVESTRRMIAAAVLFSHHVAETLKLGASDAQFMTLLDVHGPLTPGGLAELSGLRSGTVSGVLDRLENAGLIRRDRDPDDRRKVIVSPNQQAVAERVRPHYAGQADFMVTALSRYDDAQLAVIADFMRTVSAARTESRQNRN
jgi:DNA-binding MarR family transcriptional regulator